MTKRCFNGNDGSDCNDDSSSTFKTTRRHYDKLFEILNMTDKLELISASSLTGFIFKVTTNESKSYIIKIVVLAPNEQDKSISLTNCTTTVKSLQNRKKITETEKDFKYEGEIQNIIYNESRRGDRNSICPRVVYSVIYKCDISKDFLTLLDSINNINKKSTLFSFNSFRSTPEIKSVIDCLLYYFTNKFNNKEGEEYFFRLGIILMDEIPKCVTFYKFTYDNNNSENDKNLAYSNVYYQLIYLFLIIGKINFDMHMDNALVYSNNNTIKTTLIDFGIVGDLNDNNSNYLSLGEKVYINIIRGQLGDELFIIMFEDYGSIDPEYKKLDPEHVAIYQKQSKINFIMKTMNILNIICWAVNRRDYDYDINKPTIHQMNWFKPIPEVITYMEDTSNRIDYDDDDNEYEYESIDAMKMKDIIDLLMNKRDYTSIDNRIPEESFNILDINYRTTSTNFNNYKMSPI